MKHQILIVEDSFSKYLAYKSILECKLRFKVQAKIVDLDDEVMSEIRKGHHDQVLFRPAGSVVDLIEQFAVRKLNYRNVEVTLMLSEDLTEECSAALERLASVPMPLQAA